MNNANRAIGCPLFWCVVSALAWSSSACSSATKAIEATPGGSQVDPDAGSSGAPSARGSLPRIPDQAPAVAGATVDPDTLTPFCSGPVNTAVLAPSGGARVRIRFANAQATEKPTDVCVYGNSAGATSTTPGKGPGHRLTSLPLFTRACSGKTRGLAYGEVSSYFDMPAGVETIDETGTVGHKGFRGALLVAPGETCPADSGPNEIGIANVQFQPGDHTVVLHGSSELAISPPGGSPFTFSPRDTLFNLVFPDKVAAPPGGVKQTFARVLNFSVQNDDGVVTVTNTDASRTEMGRGSSTGYQAGGDPHFNASLPVSPNRTDGQNGYYPLPPGEFTWQVRGARAQTDRLQFKTTLPAGRTTAFLIGRPFFEDAARPGRPLEALVCSDDVDAVDASGVKTGLTACKVSRETSSGAVRFGNFLAEHGKNLRALDQTSSVGAGVNFCLLPTDGKTGWDAVKPMSPDPVGAAFALAPTAYTDVDPGSYLVRLIAAGASCTEPAAPSLPESLLTVERDRFYTVLASGTLFGQGQPASIFVYDDAIVSDPNEYLVRYLQVSPTVAALTDFGLPGGPLVSGVGLGQLGSGGRIDALGYAVIDNRGASTNVSYTAFPKGTPSAITCAQDRFPSDPKYTHVRRITTVYLAGGDPSKDPFSVAYQPQLVICADSAGDCSEPTACVQ